MDYIEWHNEPDRKALVQAVDALESDPVRARKMFTDLAEYGSPTGMFYLGEIYSHGIGCAVDSMAAEHWYQRASKEGSLLAWYSLGMLYLSTKRYDLAVEPLRTAAAQGYAPALNQLGQIYASGMGVEVDLEAAKKFLRRAASKGHVIAKGKLSDILRRYPEGTGDRIRGIGLLIMATIELLYIVTVEGFRSEKLR